MWRTLDLWRWRDNKKNNNDTLSWSRLCLGCSWSIDIDWYLLWKSHRSLYIIIKNIIILVLSYRSIKIEGCSLLVCVSHLVIGWPVFIMTDYILFFRYNDYNNPKWLTIFSEIWESERPKVSLSTSLRFDCYVSLFMVITVQVAGARRPAHQRSLLRTAVSRAVQYEWSGQAGLLRPVRKSRSVFTLSGTMNAVFIPSFNSWWWALPAYWGNPCLFLFLRLVTIQGLKSMKLGHFPHSKEVEDSLVICTSSLCMLGIFL